MTPTVHYSQTVAPPALLGEPGPVPRRWLAFWAIFVTVAYALLWSPHWYPLSDSSLYLSLARSLAAGRGFTYMGEPHRLVPPGTPALFAVVFRLGGGIGALQALLIVFMLIAHTLCFLTLRRWVSERLALAATLAAAASYWVFVNAFTVMSEPAGLALFWGGLLAMTRAAQNERHRWPMVILACGLLIASMENRIATTALVPGAFAALWMWTRGTVKLRARLGWAAVFLVGFGVALAIYRFPAKLQTLVGMRPAVVATGGGPSLTADVEASDNTEFREGRYKPFLLYGVKRDLKHMLLDPPVLAGRWICEGMAMPWVAVFESKNKWVSESSKMVALAAMILGVWGFVALLRRRSWWVVGLLVYFLLPWLQWGTRLKPRYMAPIAPVLFIALWLAITQLWEHFSRGKSGRGSLVMKLLLVAIVLGNVPAWAMEFYVRHGTSRDFYDVARRGAFAELVDIGGYLQQHAKPTDAVYLNAGRHRRIVYFLAGRRVEVPATRGREYDLRMPAWEDTSRPGNQARRASRAAMERFFARVPATEKYAVVYCESAGWPEWHWPLSEAQKKPGDEFFRLYERQPDGAFRRIFPERNRKYVKEIPPSGI